MIEKTIQQKLMGTAFSLGICAATAATADYWLAQGVAEIQRIEALLSEYKTDSQTALINNANQITPISINQEVFELIERCQNIATLTNGAFDIATASLKKLYKFNNQKQNFPSEAEIKIALEKVGIRKLILNTTNRSIVKQHPETTISFNAIGKGYAADRVKQLWTVNGITNGFINASGDLCAFGTKADGSPWSIAVSNPDEKNKPLFYLPLQHQAIATSGDCEQHFLFEGKRYSHNINPFTGKPLQGIKSVSIVSPSAELSDALATAVYVMGEKKGIEFVNQLPHTHAIIINQKNKVYLSEKLSYEAIDKP